MNTRERKSDRCADLSHLDRHNVSWPFTVRFTISFASAGTCFVQPIIGCLEVNRLKRGSRSLAPAEQNCAYEWANNLPTLVNLTEPSLDLLCLTEITLFLSLRLVWALTSYR
jgi:hypothetical protein